MKVCDDCKYAEWDRTSNGRLHPSKQGTCKFNKKVPVPVSSARAWHEGYVVEIKGGYITRGHPHLQDCAYYGPADASKTSG